MAACAAAPASRTSSVRLPTPPVDDTSDFVTSDILTTEVRGTPCRSATSASVESTVFGTVLDVSYTIVEVQECVSDSPSSSRSGRLAEATRAALLAFGGVSAGTAAADAAADAGAARSRERV